MNTQNKITINGNIVSFESDDTILDVARQNSVDIPTLCHLRGTIPTGACRVCVVEVQGSRSLVASCSTPAANGMVVLTESPEVVDSRKMTIQLLLSNGNHNCAARSSDGNDWTDFQLRVQQEDGNGELCPAWGDCELQNLAYRYQVTGDRFTGDEKTYPIEDVNPFIVRDFSRCVLCGRCVQACNEVQVNEAIDFGYRGAKAKIIAAGDRPLRDSDCVFCGECVQVCPVAALMEKDSRFTCRSWEAKKIKTTCSYCGVGCQMYLHVKENRIFRVTGVEDCLPNSGSLCVKGRFGFNFVHSNERLTTPLIKTEDGFREAEWEEALDLVAKRFSDIKEEHGSDSIGVLTSARITNEENYIANKFTRAVLKTNNIDHCARL